MQIGDDEVSWRFEYLKPPLFHAPWPFFHSGIHDRAASIWILKMKKLVQDLVQHPYGRLFQFNRERKNKDIHA